MNVRTALTRSAAPAVVALSLSVAGGAVPAPATGAAPATAAAATCPRPAVGPPLLALPAPTRFRPRVRSDYFPLRPGARWRYRGFGSEAGQTEVVTVLSRTKPILGIRATVVKDIAREDGEVIERTFDWYAQDRRGRVWYLGENTTSYDGGTSSKEGSWRAGRDCARAGVVMFPHPALHRAYRQEFLRGEAEDEGMVLDGRARVGLAAGQFRRVLVTKDFTTLEPRLLELKFYAPGVGLVLEEGVSPDQGRVELVSFRRG